MGIMAVYNAGMKPNHKNRVALSIYLPLSPEDMRPSLKAFRSFAGQFGVTVEWEESDVFLSSSDWSSERMTALVDEVLIPMLEQVQEWSIQEVSR